MVKNTVVLAAALLATTTLCDSVVARNESVAVTEATACSPCGNPNVWKDVTGVCAQLMPKEQVYNVFFQQKGGDFKQCNCCRSFNDGPYGTFGDDWHHHKIESKVECYYRSPSGKQQINKWYWDASHRCKAENKAWQAKYGK